MAAVLERTAPKATGQKHTMTPEQYLAWERDPARASERKSEYIYGEVIEVPGASFPHNVIANAVSTSLTIQLGDRCYVASSEQRVRVGGGNAYVYPDATVICDEPQFLDNQFDTLLNPTMLVEVLSPSTGNYDRGTKFELYREIDSLTDYLMLSQDEPRIDHYARVDENEWRLKAYRGLDAVAKIDSLSCALPLAEIYARIKFNN